MIERVNVSMGRFDNLLFRMRTILLQQKKITAGNIKEVPVIINNFNRLECLKAQIDWLGNAGFKNIYIIDNSSTYEPLLEFYKKTKCHVFKLDTNIGFLALWKTIIFQRFKNSYYIYTDPDIVPKENCPLNAVERFYFLLQKYPKIDKVGFGLAIDDLPDHYPLKSKVINWEKKFWENEIEENVFKAVIDTTFALYRPRVMGGSELNALRTGDPFIARHLTWYVDLNALSEEEIYYMSKAQADSSWYAELSGKKRNIKY